MKNNKRQWFRTPAATWTLFIAAIALLLFAGIGGTRAALNKLSDKYVAEVSMQDIGITLMENGSEVAKRDYDYAKKDDSWIVSSSGKLLADMLKDGEQPDIGKAYDETLAVKNSGHINEYVRVTIRRYWLDKDGNKMNDLEPEQIGLMLDHKNLDEETTLGDWVKDAAATTTERSVFYYTKLLGPGETTSNLTDKFFIRGDLLNKYTTNVEKEGDTITKITTAYDYDGVQFCLEVTADAVQDHNAQAAILSAWGRNVTVSGSGLSLQ